MYVRTFFERVCHEVLKFIHVYDFVIACKPVKEGLHGLLSYFLVRLALHVAFLWTGHLLCENAEEEISFLIRFEGTQHQHVATWVKVKTLEDLASVGETARGGLGAVVQDVLCVN